MKKDTTSGNLKKHSQLGMNASTASHRLVKDLLFKFAVDAGHVCFRCNKDLVRETFSIEHKIAWLDSEYPIDLFFDLNNIAFSHLPCNVGAAKRDIKPCGTEASYKRGCRCRDCIEAHRVSCKENNERYPYDPEIRKDKYRRLGT